MAQSMGEPGRALLRTVEGLRLQAYRCPAGIWTIGYGHTRGVQAGDGISAAQAENYLREDTARCAEGVAALVQVPLNAGQFDALCCFAFNVGVNALARSSLLRLLNRGWYAQVPAQLARWTKADSRELPGLVRRRRLEIDLWNSGS